MFISAAVKNNVLALLLSLAVVYGPMMIAEYHPYGMQKALDLIPLVGSSTDIFRTNTFRILGKLILSPRLSRSTDGQLKESSKISRRNLREGDLVFFTSRASH